MTHHVLVLRLPNVLFWRLYRTSVIKRDRNGGFYRENGQRQTIGSIGATLSHVDIDDATRHTAVELRSNRHRRRSRRPIGGR